MIRTATTEQVAAGVQVLIPLNSGHDPDRKSLAVGGPSGVLIPLNSGHDPDREEFLAHAGERS